MFILLVLKHLKVVHWFHLCNYANWEKIYLSIDPKAGPSLSTVFYSTFYIVKALCGGNIASDPSPVCSTSRLHQCYYCIPGRALLTAIPVRHLGLIILYVFGLLGQR